MGPTILPRAKLKPRGLILVATTVTIVWIAISSWLLAHGVVAAYASSPWLVVLAHTFAVGSIVALWWSAFRSWALNADLPDARQFEHIFHNAPDAMLLVDAAGVIQHANPNAAELFEYHPNELVGQSVENLIDGDFRSQHIELREGFMEQPKARHMGISGSLFGVNKNGDRVPINVRLSPIAFDHQPMVVVALNDDSERRLAQEAIESKSRHLRAALDSMEGGVLLFDDNWKLVLWNEQVLEMLEFDADSMASVESLKSVLLKRFQEGHVVDPSARDLEPEEFAAKRYKEITSPSFRSLEIVTGERSLVCTKRSLVSGYHAINILDRTEDFRQRSELLSDVVNSTNQCLISFDANHRIISWNRRFEQMYGSNLSKLHLGMPFLDLCNAIVSAYPEFQLPTGSVFSAERALFSGEGHSWESNLAGTIYDTRSEPTSKNGVVLTFTDITEQRKWNRLRTLDALVTRLANETVDPKVAVERCMGAVCEHTDFVAVHEYRTQRVDGESKLVAVSAWLKDQNPDLQTFSTEFCNIQLKLGEATPGRVYHSRQPAWTEDISHGKIRSRVDTALSAGLRSSVALPVLVRGEVRAVLEFYSKVQLTQDPSLTETLARIGAHIGRVFEREEVTRALEDARHQAESAAATQAQFLANMSHEIRTPMNAIIGLAELMRDTNLSARQSKYLDDTYSSAQDLLSLIDDILDFSKIEAGELKMESIDFDLSDIFRQVSNTVGITAAEKGLELRFNAPSTLPGTLVGDPLRLKQVLLNLCNNAVKFTHEGQVIVAVRVVGLNDAEIELRFSVDDTGIGMSQEEASALFTPFAQADASITRRYGGTGLGLVISRELVERMGGNIGVYSDAGHGSSFWFTARFGLSALIQDANELPESLIGKRALVVADNKADRLVLSQYLAMFKLDVERCDNGEAAIELMESAGEVPFDLVLIDWHLPNVNGLEIGQRIQHSPCVTSQPKMIIVCASGRDSLKHDIDALGIAEVVVKPITPDSLRYAIEAAYGVQAKLAPNSHDHGVFQRDVFDGARVLVVEDNEVNQKVALEILRRAGITVFIATNGLDAINRLEAGEAFDLILMDLQMPIMDGLTAAKKIRADERFVNIPIVAMTANVMRGDREKTLAAGMQGHLGKPVNLDELYEILGRHLRPFRRVDDIGGFEESDATSQVSLKPNKLASHVNLEMAYARIGNDHQFFKQLLMQFATRSAALVSQLTQAMAVKDIKQAAEILDTLKGAAAELCIDRVASLAERLEEQVKTGDEEGEKTVQLLTQELQEIEHAIAQLRPEAMANRDLADTDSPTEDELPLREHLAGAMEADLGASLVDSDETSAWSTRAPIDESVLKNIFGDDEALFDEILTDFEVSSEGVVVELREAVNLGTPTAVRQVSHKFKSSARSVGAVQLGDLCQDLEQRCRADCDEDCISELSERIFDEYARVSSYIAAHHQAMASRPNSRLS